MIQRWAPAAASSLSLALLSACAADAPRGPSFEINVAPLSLPGVSDACFALTVYDDVGDDAEVVWSEDTICSSRFGNGAGGDVTYIGTCVATPDGHLNAVDLVLTDLYRSGSAPDGTTLATTLYDNPCPGDAPCRLEAPCHENADTPVTFNLTVMRDAGQGFFDIAVSFEDVFCSAKLDCNDALLHDGDDRAETAIVAFACTSGGDETNLYLDDVVIACDGVPTVTVDPARGPGQLGAQPGSFESAVYFGDEQLEGFEKCYWNVAVGLDLDALPGDCWLTARGTASEAALDVVGGRHATTADTKYPFIEWQVQLTSDGAMVCAENQLNVEGSGVQTAYTPFAGRSFAHRRACGPVDNPPRLVATPGNIGIPQGVTTNDQVAAYFVDDEGPVTLSLHAAPAWVTLTGGTLFVRPTPDVSGNFSATVRATDSAGQFVEHRFGIFITPTPPDRAPTITNIPTLTVPEGESFVLDLDTIFVDPDGDPLFIAFGPDAPAFTTIVGHELRVNPGFDDATDGVTLEIIAFDGPLYVIAAIPLIVPNVD